MPTTPPGRDDLDIEHVNHQRVTWLGATYCDRPSHGIPATDRRPRQVNQLADRIYEHGTAACVLGLEDYGRARINRQNRRS
jgi:hypothetical protein